jgi:hypothetical protein
MVLKFLFKALRTEVASFVSLGIHNNSSVVALIMLQIDENYAVLTQYKVTFPMPWYRLLYLFRAVHQPCDLDECFIANLAAMPEW